MNKTIRVLSYNIHKGFSHSNAKFLLDSIRDSIRLVDAELVFLQEVVGQHKKHEKKVADWPTEAQFEYLADSVWPHYAYGKNAVYKHGNHGNAILSKFPISKWLNYDISTNRIEQRGALYACLEIPDWPTPVHCVSTHFGLTPRGRKLQVQMLTEMLGSASPTAEPLLLVGDFNDWNQSTSPILQESLGLSEVFKEASGSYAKTYPARLPLLKLDRIYSRGFMTKKVEVLTGKPWRSLSDHVPLLAELELQS